MHTDSLQTCAMQFGFQSNHSTVLCSLLQFIIETINHNVNEGSNVYSCLLDASKAFDRVHWGRLFKILIKRKVSFLNLYVYYLIAILDNLHVLHGDYSNLVIFR